MSVKLHFHLDYFSKSCGDLSEEQGERFHQDIHILEERDQGWWNVNFLTDYVVLETGCGGYQAQEGELEKTFHPWIASFVYFSVYYGTMWVFLEYISPKFSIICLIQPENIVIILFYTFQVRTCILKIWSGEKKGFGFSFKNCLKTSYYIFDLENIAGQCNE